MAIMDKKAYASLLKKERQRRGRILFVVSAVHNLCVCLLYLVYSYLLWG